MVLSDISKVEPLSHVTVPREGPVRCSRAVAPASGYAPRSSSIAYAFFRKRGRRPKPRATGTIIRRAHGPPISVTKVDHIHPYVTDKFEAAKWYERLLGFQVVGELHANKYPKAPLDVANANASVKFALFSTDDPAQMGSTATVALRVAPDV